MKTKRIAYCHPGASFSACFAAARKEGYDEFEWRGGRFTTRYAEEVSSAGPEYDGHPIERGEIRYDKPTGNWLAGWKAGRAAAAAEAARMGAVWASEAEQFERDGLMALRAKNRNRSEAAEYVAFSIRALFEPEEPGRG